MNLWRLYKLEVAPSGFLKIFLFDTFKGTVLPE
jgi:hypothetical protein